MAKKKYRQSCLSSNKVLDAAKGVSVAKAPDGKVILSQMSFLAMWLMQTFKKRGHTTKEKNSFMNFLNIELNQFVSILVFVVVVNGRIKVQPTVVLQAK
jgi:hypothetical protein